MVRGVAWNCDVAAFVITMRMGEIYAHVETFSSRLTIMKHLITYQRNKLLITHWFDEIFSRCACNLCSLFSTIAIDVKMRWKCARVHCKWEECWKLGPLIPYLMFERQIYRNMSKCGNNNTSDNMDSLRFQCSFFVVCSVGRSVCIYNVNS